MKAVRLDDAASVAFTIFALAMGASACTSHEDRATRDAATNPSSDKDAASPTCGETTSASTYRPGTTAGQLMHAGVARGFRVHVPPGYDGSTPVPLVLMFHGGGGNGRQFEEASSGMDPVADREGFVAVYPEGSGVLRTWNGGGCCGYAVENDVDDVGFVSALLDHLEASLCVDRLRVFASGMSNGAIMSHRLACELSERIAAIAPVAGTDNTLACSPSRPVPILMIHGSADGHVPWQGGRGCGPANVSFTSVPTTLERWRARNDCSASSTPGFEQGEGRCEASTGCAAEVVLCTIEGGGHNWPGGEPIGVSSFRVHMKAGRREDFCCS